MYQTLLGPPISHNRRSRILDIKTLEEDPGAAQEFARSKAAARKEGLTGVEFKDIAGLDPILGEVLEVRQLLAPLCWTTVGDGQFDILGTLVAAACCHLKIVWQLAVNNSRCIMTRQRLAKKRLCVAGM
jgi:hypothetical protein